MEVVDTPTIFVRDPFMRLKQKKLRSVANQKEGWRERALSQAAEAEKRDEEEEGTPLLRRERRRDAPRKRRQANPSSMSIPKKAKARGLTCACVLGLSLFESSY